MPTKTTAVSVLVAAILVLATMSTEAADYYVSVSGNDSNSGAKSAPWRTIEKANSALRAGDTLNFLPGVHVGVIQPRNSGTGSAPIVYRSLPGQRATVSAPSGVSSAVVLTESYIRVENLDIRHDRPPSGENSFNIDIAGGNARHNVIRGCNLKGTNRVSDEHAAGIREGGVRLRNGAAHNVVENNLIENYTLQGVKFTELASRNFIRGNNIRNNWGDAVRVDAHFGECQGNIIENNQLSGSVSSDGVQTNRQWGEDKGDTSNHCLVIRRNLIHGNGENGIDIKGSRRFLIEGNTIYGNISDNDGFTDGVHQRYSSPGGIHNGGGNGSVHIIVRNNVIFDNASGSLAQDGWKVYNNTIVANNRDWEGPNSQFDGNSFPSYVGIRSNSSTGTAIRNNIIVDHTVAEISVDADARLEIDNNLYFNNRNPVRLVVYRGDSDWAAYSLSAWTSVLQELPGVTGFDRNSIEASPRFQNVPAFASGDATRFDFRLKPDSPAVDAGGYLTTTSSNGSGKTLRVRDAGYFFDGFGAVPGDKIRIGSNPPVRIVSVGSDNQTITLAQSVTWRGGDPVSLDYAGTAPDIGAFEFAYEVGEPKAPVLGTLN